MPSVCQIFPIVSTPQMDRALAFYRDLLGGRVTFEYPGPDGEIVYAGLEIGSSHLGLGLMTESRSVSSSPISLWVYTDDCDAVVERMRSAGIRVTQEPADQPGGNGLPASWTRTTTRSSWDRRRNKIWERVAERRPG